MKRCPTCQRVYTDTSLNFCRDDGALLVMEGGRRAYDSQQRLSGAVPFDSDALPTRVFLTGARNSGPTEQPAHWTAPLQPPRGKRAARSKVIDSLAVLPFVNDSRDADMEYLSDGITEDIINSLSPLPKLRVVPRSTVFRYKGRDVDPQIVGHELGVRAVLTGRIQQVGELLITRTELIDVEQDSQLWGERYKTKVADILALQEEISREISGKLRLRLSGEDKKRLAKRYTENTKAYQLYLKGRYYTNKRTEEWIKKGIESFHQATDLDPNYALAYAGIADAYAFLASSTGGYPPHEAYPKAKAAALKALEIDDALAEAHTSLGFFRLLYDWDFVEAEREFKRAVKLNPSYANAHDGYGFYLKAMGRHEEALKECQQVQRLDPLSLFANVSTGWAYYFARKFERAVEQGQKALELEPRFDFAHWIMGIALAQQGRMQESVAALNQAHIASGGGLTFAAHLGYAYGLAGQREAAREMLTRLEEIARQKYVSSYYFAIIHLGLGEMDEVFAQLERAYEERSGFLTFLKVEPMLDPLRQDDRFASLMERLRLS